MKIVLIMIMGFCIAMFALYCQAQVHTTVSEYAVELVKQGVSSDWDFQKSYEPCMCPSVKKAVLANPGSADEWVKARKYGLLMNVIEVKEAPGYSDTIKVDVKTAMEKAKQPVVFRFWIKQEADLLCLYGYNFFEEFAKP